MQEPGPAESPGKVGWAVPIAHLWMTVAAVLETVVLLRSAGGPFSYARAFITADFSVMARAFLNHGFWTLRFVPVNNNPPLGLERSAYLHWPPLTPVLLGAWYGVFGVSEVAAHTFGFLTAVLMGLALYLLGRQVLGTLGGPVAVLTWLVLPVTRDYIHLVSPQNLSMPLSVLALVCAMKALEGGAAQRRWTLAGVLMICLSAAASWEAFFCAAGLWLAGALTRRIEVVRIGLAYAMASAAVITSILLLYAFTYPELVKELAQQVLYRMGIRNVVSAGVLHVHSLATQIPKSQLLTQPFQNLLVMLGGISLAATGIALLTSLDRRRHDLAVIVLLATAAPWIMWYVVFLNDVAIHDFEAVVATPCVSLGVAWCAVMATQYLAGQPFHRWRLVALLLFPGIAVLPLLEDTVPYLGRIAGHEPGFRSSLYTDHLVQLGREIGRLTPENAIVLTAEDDTVPVFYSGRHTVRFIMNADMALQKLPRVRQAFPGSSVYVAVTRDVQNSFWPLLGDPRFARTAGDGVTMLQLVDCEGSRCSSPLDVR